MPSQAEIVAFVAGETGRPISTIDPEDLLGSTGCDGDDAFELIEAYGAVFGVDLTGYVWQYHHADEKTVLSSFRRAPMEHIGRIPLTAGILASCARSGVWDLDYPEHNLSKFRLGDYLGPVPVILAVLGLLITALVIFGSGACGTNCP